MANIYEFEIYGLEPVKVVRFFAESVRDAEIKLDNLFPIESARKLEGWKYLSEEKLEDK